MDYFLFRPFYFLILSLIVFSLFRNLFINLFKDFTIIPFLVLTIAIIIELLLYYFFQNHLNPPKILKEKYSNIIFLQMSYKYTFYKFFDILFQQMMIVVLIYKLLEHFQNIKIILLVIVFLFGAVHLPLLKFFKIGLGSFFVSMSMIGIVFFTLLILYFNYGMIYSYTLHWAFYTFLGGFFWLYKLKIKN